MSEIQCAFCHKHILESQAINIGSYDTCEECVGIASTSRCRNGGGICNAHGPCAGYNGIASETHEYQSEHCWDRIMSSMHH